MEDFYFGTSGHEILNEQLYCKFLRSLNRGRIIGVFKTIENSYSRALSTNIFVRIVSVSYPVPRLFKKDTPGEIIVELSNGTKVPLFTITFYNTSEYMFSISNNIVNAIRNEEVDIPGSLPVNTIGYTVRIYDDNITLKNAMEETNRKRANALETKRILEIQEKQRLQEEEQKRIEYYNQNEEAGRIINDLFHKP